MDSKLSVALVTDEQQSVTALHLGSAIILYDFSNCGSVIRQPNFKSLLDSQDTFVFIVTGEKTLSQTIFAQLEIFDLQQI